MERKATIYYHDIGDYLERSEKLAIIKEYGSVMNPKMQWEKITPNEKHDWINQRDGTFDEMIPINSEDKFDLQAQSFFVVNSRGYETARDFWVYASSEKNLKENVQCLINEYNNNIGKKDKSELNYDPTKISWSSNLIAKVLRGERISEKIVITSAMYRPFFKQYTVIQSDFINRKGQFDYFFPTPETKNLVICVPGIGNTKDFSVIITDTIPDLGIESASQCFPLYYYEPVNSQLSTVNCPELPLFDSTEISDAGSVSSQESIVSQLSTNSSQLGTCASSARKLSTLNSQFSIKYAITDWILAEVRRRFPTSGKSITKEHIFYYVYGILHSKQYRERFASDLKKSLPRIPIVDDINTFMDFYNAGKRLADLHLNYENVPAYDGVTLETIKPVVYKIPTEKPKLDLDYGELMAAEPSPKFTNDFDEYKYYAVEKMRFLQKGQKDTIIYNHYITIKNIPAKAYDYIVNGKSAIEWIMERYCVSTDKASGIKNDCNDWAREHEKPRYVLDLLLSVINVSVQTAEIVEGLPKVEW